MVDAELLWYERSRRQGRDLQVLSRLSRLSLPRITVFSDATSARQSGDIGYHDPSVMPAASDFAELLPTVSVCLTAQ
jgi:hypothetical protein